MLQDYVSTVEALLAMSLFYRHVMGHMQGAVSFYKSVNNGLENKNECPIRIGNTTFDNEQQRKLLSAIITFDRIKNRYQLGPSFFEYSETIQFLRNCKDLFYQKEYEENDPI